jgi:hypothetical protein
MLLTPAAASRSQTDWATSAGVVMTPMEAWVVATTSASSSSGRTVCPPMRWPIRAVAASKSPTNSKGRYSFASSKAFALDSQHFAMIHLPGSEPSELPLKFGIPRTGSGMRSSGALADARR